MTIFLKTLWYILNGDKMKKTIGLIIISISLGIGFTFFFLNKQNIYAKEEYMVYVFQAGAYQDFENASQKLNEVPVGVMVYEEGLYKIYLAIYKDFNLINTMVNYFKKQNIEIYLKNITISKQFFKKLNNYEKLLKRDNNEKQYDSINQQILNDYLESIKND